MTPGSEGTADALERWFGLTGRTALVVGASSGLGARAARVLAASGADVGLYARRRERLEAEAEAIHALGRGVSVVEGDVTERGSIDAAVARVEAELGPVSVLVYASGISPLGRAERHAREKWDRALAVNLTGAFEASQSVARRCIERGEPASIIHVASVAGVGAGPVHRSASYSASKGGLVNLTRQLATEWAPHRIRVNALVPGYFATELTIDPRHGDIAPDQKQRIEQLTPMGRVGEIHEIDTAIAFLAAPASSYVTGALIAVDGGWTAW
jgi:gluconate 5-dehydrogenase